MWPSCRDYFNATCLDTPLKCQRNPEGVTKSELFDLYRHRHAGRNRAALNARVQDAKDKYRIRLMKAAVPEAMLVDLCPCDTPLAGWLLHKTSDFIDERGNMGLGPG